MFGEVNAACPGEAGNDAVVAVEVADLEFGAEGWLWCAAEWGTPERDGQGNRRWGLAK